MADRGLAGPASSTGGGPRRRAREWAVLDRRPKFVEAGDLPAAGVEFAVNHAAPPRLATILLSRALVPAADGDGHVECADQEGNLLLSVCSTHGGRFFLVCRPESGRAHMLPALPQDLGVLRYAPHACTGILPAAAGSGGGGHYVVAQLEHASDSALHRSSAPTPTRRVFVFFSSSQSWISKDVTIGLPPRFEALSSDDEDAGVKVEKVAGEQQFVNFEPETVICHDDAGVLVFVDLEHGLLLMLDPMVAGAGAGAARIVALPASEDGGPTAQAAADARHAAPRRCVAFSQGTICVLEMYAGTVSLSCLRAEDEWQIVFRIGADEAFWSNPTIGNLTAYAAACLGPIDPTNWHNLTFFVPDAEVGFTVVVDPRQSFPRRVRFGEQANADAESWLQTVVWRFRPTDPAAVAESTAGRESSAGTWRWIRKLAGKTKHMGAKAVRTCRKHVDKIPPMAQVAGAVAAFCGGGQLASAVVGTAAGLVTVNSAAGAGEEIGSGIGRWWSTGPALDSRVVGNQIEAWQVIKEWKDLDKPGNMVVDAAPGLNQQQVDQLRRFFYDHDAEALLPVFSDFEIVSHALNF